MDVLKKDFDYILLDLPPVTAVSDPLVASKLVDGMVLVVRQNYSNKRSLAEAVRQLRFVDTKILGFVMTDSDTGSKGRKKYYKKYYKQYGYGYGYGYGDSTAQKREKRTRSKRRERKPAHEIYIPICFPVWTMGAPPWRKVFGWEKLWQSKESLLLLPHLILMPLSNGLPSFLNTGIKQNGTCGANGPRSFLHFG